MEVVLRQLIRENCPEYIKEKISYNVPFFYGNKGLCIIWPAYIPRGGIKEGVLLGFWHRKELRDGDAYLDHGTNKPTYFKIFLNVEEIDHNAIHQITQRSDQP